MTPTIVTITGPSCAGKSTLELLLRSELGFSKATSVTTRPIREGEEQDRDYYFVSPEQFDEVVAQGKMVEHVEFDGNCYGLSASEVEHLAMLGRPIAVVCDPNGQEQIRAYCAKKRWNYLSVFITNPIRVIAERFLSRFFDETAFENRAEVFRKTKIFARRMQEMMTTERAWSNEAFYGSRYDLTFNQFDKENQQEVIDRIETRLLRFEERAA